MQLATQTPIRGPVSSAEWSLVPRAVIAGAPKCGTSSLYHWLADHPDTAPSLKKETYFLMDRESLMFNLADWSYHGHGPEAYARCYPELNGRAAFEATPDYLYQYTAPKALGSMDPVPHVFFVLRRPSRRIHSAWRFYRGTLGLLENDMDFCEFADLLLAADGPAPGVHPLASRTLEQSRYIGYLCRWLEHLPADKVHVMQFEELCRSPRRIMGRFCRAMGIDESFYDDYDFSVQNRSQEARSTGLVRLRNRIEPLLPGGLLREGLKGLYRAVNLRGTRACSEHDLRRAYLRLDAHFAPDSAALASLFRIDLALWEG